jgi:antitoxin (DNA-binding transcriptional repressor) of toxin-antitoxin stability system
MAIPISALQRNAAEVVRRVAASGLAEEITDRGRVVGLLAPPPPVDGLERLRQSGAVRRAEPGGIRPLLTELADLPSIGLQQALEEQRNTEW